MPVKKKKAKKAVGRPVGRPRRNGPAPNKPMTGVEVARAVSEASGISQTDVKHVLFEYENLILKELAQGKKFKLGSLMNLEPKLKGATKARMGRNPRTGEPVKVSAKPESTRLSVRVLKGPKEAIPSAKKLKAFLGL